MKKKQQLEQIASKMNLKTSQLLSIIDNYLNGADKNIKICDEQKIALQFNKIYALVNQLEDYEFGKDILNELGELECLV